MDVISTLAQTYYAYSSTNDLSMFMNGFAYFIYIVLLVFVTVGLWQMFEKAEEPGWKAIIPLYNTFILFRIAGRNGWWLLLLFVPVVNLVLYVIVMLDLGKHFGKSWLWSVFLLMIFPYVGYLLLGYGNDKYVGAKHE